MMSKRNNIFKNATREDFKSLLYESDRGCVLVLQSFFDEKLKLLLEKTIRLNHAEYKGVKEDFYKDIFKLNGPMGTFSGRLKMAFAFTVLTHEQYEALDALRSVRNAIAHSPFNFSLKNADVQQELKKFTKLATKVDHKKFRKLLKIEDSEGDFGGKFELVTAGFHIHIGMLPKVFKLSTQLSVRRVADAVKKVQEKFNNLTEQTPQE